MLKRLRLAKLTGNLIERLLYYAPPFSDYICYNKHFETYIPATQK